MKKHTDQEIIDALKEKYGTHCEASAALGYANPSAYRKARKSGLPQWRRDIALQLLGIDESEVSVCNADCPLFSKLGTEHESESCPTCEARKPEVPKNPACRSCNRP